MKDDPLLQPLRLDRHTLPNRVVMTVVKPGYGTPDGELTERHVIGDALQPRKALEAIREGLDVGRRL